MWLGMLTVSCVLKIIIPRNTGLLAPQTLYLKNKLVTATKPLCISLYKLLKAEIH